MEELGKRERRPTPRLQQNVWGGGGMNLVADEEMVVRLIVAEE